MCLVIAACKKPVKLNLKPDDIRAEVLAHVRPFLGRAEYAVTDADIVEPCLAWGLQSGTTRRYAVDIASGCIDSKLDVYSGKEASRVAKKIEAYYAHPAITREADRVTVDAGLPPGKIDYFRGAYTLRSAYLDDQRWKQSEIERFLKLAMTTYPDARQYTATVLILNRTRSDRAPQWRYTYERGSDRIRVESPDAPPGVMFASDAFRRDVGN